MMNIKERNKIMDLLTTVIEAIEYARKNRDEAKNYLNDCILAINEIDEYLKVHTSEYDLIKMDYAKKSLEKAKEANDLSKLGRWLRQSQKDIKLVKSVIRNKMNVRYQVFFLPYKASMWTAFDSIWRAASADPNCDCIVMPIPYYELDSEGKLDKYCYENKGYPAEVPIVHFEDYDLEAQRPDIIFIHNPYDGTNNLTRVDEKYYAKTLRGYTNMLVYSPYFIIRWYNPTKGSLQCVTPGAIYANKVIVQSERLKEIYVEHGHNPDKFLVLGSPKVDAVVKNMQNPPRVPNEWMEKIKDKHVFLMNTHMSFFSRYGDYAFEKIGNIIGYYSEHKDCTLIWRPHPLTEAMLENKFPQYLERYKRLLSSVESSSNGIIDKFSDYKYAFSVSKAMLSTYSSLVTEYMVTGKPIYIFQKRNNEAFNKVSPVDYSFNYYYKPYEFNEKGFIEMVTKGEDVLYEDRMKMIKKAFVNSTDGSCGKKVYEYLKKELYQDKG